MIYYADKTKPTNNHVKKLIGTENQVFWIIFAKKFYAIVLQIFL